MGTRLETQFSGHERLSVRFAWPPNIWPHRLNRQPTMDGSHDRRLLHSFHRRRTRSRPMAASSFVQCNCFCVCVSSRLFPPSREPTKLARGARAPGEGQTHSSSAPLRDQVWSRLLRNCSVSHGKMRPRCDSTRLSQRPLPIDGEHEAVDAAANEIGRAHV